MASPVSVSLGGGGGADTFPGGGITPSGGGDFDSQLGSALSSAFDSASEEPASPEPVSEPESAPISEPTPEAPVIDEPAPAEPSDAAPAQAATPGEYQLSPDGKSYLVPKSDYQAIKGIQQYHTAVSQLYPTPGDAQASFEHASTFRQIANDWASGSDPNINSVMNYWAGGDHEPGSPLQQRFQQSFVKMAERMPETLAKINPQAYSSLQDSMIQRRISDAYEKAALEQRPGDFDADGRPIEGSPFRMAQEMDYGVNGKYQTELKRIDPQVRAQQDFERRQQEFNTQRAQMQSSQLEQFNQAHIEGAKFNEASGLVDKILAPVKTRYNETVFNDLKSNINRELIDAMAGRATATYPNGIPGQREWIAEHKQAFDQLVNDFRTSWTPTAPGRGLEARAQAFRQEYLNRANRYLPSIAKPRIETATRTPGAARTTNGKFASPKPTTQPQSAPSPQPNGRLTSDQFDAELRKAMTIA